MHSEIAIFAHSRPYLHVARGKSQGATWRFESVPIGTHDPLPPPQPRRGIIFKAERRLEHVTPRTARGEQTQKDVKINGTNYLKSFRINKSIKKTNSKRTVFCMKRGLIEVKKVAKSATRREELVHEV
jgi:hypothetical protein